MGKGRKGGEIIFSIFRGGREDLCSQKRRSRRSRRRRRRKSSRRRKVGNLCNPWSVVQHQSLLDSSGVD